MDTDTPMSEFPFPDVPGGFIEVVLDALDPAPDGTMTPGCPFLHEFVPCDAGARDLSEVLDPALALNATVPSRLRFGINPRSTRRSGGPWVMEVSRLAIRAPRAPLDAMIASPRIRVRISALENV